MSSPRPQPQKRRGSFGASEDEPNIKKAKHEPLADPFTKSSTSNIAPTPRPVDPSEPVLPNVEKVETIQSDDTKSTQSSGQASPQVQLSANGRVPIKSLFTPRKVNVDPPKANSAWGTKPYPGPDGPQPRPDLPPARTSNAQTVPPLFEDRKFKFKPGRYHKSFGDYYVQVEADEDTAMLDQEDNLIIPLMDMRPVGGKNREPRREPVFYAYENGVPNSWESEQALKALNDRRREAIARITDEAPWTDLEREYLAELCKEHPNASIFEYAERFNYRFKGDFKEKTAFSFDEHHSGRTLESVRYEYLTFKFLYDEGKVPDPKRQGMDKTRQKRKNNKKIEGPLERMLTKFGPKKVLKKPYSKKKSNAYIVNSDNESGVQSSTAATYQYNKPKLSAPYEELLDLAGYYDDVPNGSSPPRITKKFLNIDHSVQVPEDRAWMLDSDPDSLSDLSSTLSTRVSSPVISHVPSEELFDIPELGDHHQDTFTSQGSGKAFLCAGYDYAGVCDVIRTTISEHAKTSSKDTAGLERFAK